MAHASLQVRAISLARGMHVGLCSVQADTSHAFEVISVFLFSR